MVKNFILAKDAKHMAETSEKLLNNVFKLIKDAASYGRCTTVFDIFEVAEVVVTNMISTLTEAGYQVEVITDDDGKQVALTISW
jgi:hypothetical protein